MIDALAKFVLGLPGWVALAFVFALPGLESSAFVGFVFPGEVALILGGVLAAQGAIPLWAVLAVGFLGAVIGDSVGYAVGHRYGRPILDATVGRLVKPDHVDRAERYLAERGGKAVFLGRFTAALRVMIPGMAGMAGLRYRVFLAYNVAGAAGWVTLSVLLGYIGGASWKHVAHLASRIGLGALAVLIVLAVLPLVWRRVRRASWLRRLAEHPLPRGLERRFPRSTRWLTQRLDPRVRSGLPATIAAVVLAAATWTFLGITQDVSAGEGLTRTDPGVHTWVLAHRTQALDTFFRLTTHLGSTIVLVPVLVVVAALLTRRRRTPVPAVAAFVVFGAAMLLHALVRQLVHRARPPMSDWIAPASGFSYPSGHTTQAWAAWGLLALFACVYGGRRLRPFAITAGLVIGVVVAASRVYLGVHWLTDVLGGATMSVALLALASLVWLLLAPSERPLDHLVEPLPTEDPAGERTRQGPQERHGPDPAAGL
ncbi:hypothetical protein GCM10009798_43230 [Nocardioides panacihumi]|uniref:Phosphatidic acid phosphatase type 2/haloperoxidase domain-containing protein n=1 Tax=Nocardioides panacihumi TaxID=400774 RepID=A0ABP5DBL6_9ACTN